MDAHGTSRVSAKGSASIENVQEGLPSSAIRV